MQAEKKQNEFSKMYVSMLEDFERFCQFLLPSMDGDATRSRIMFMLRSHIKAQGSIEVGQPYVAYEEFGKELGQKSAFFCSNHEMSRESI